jgi:hypothetical protein
MAISSSYSSVQLGNTAKALNSGNTNLDVTLFNVPIVTAQLTLEKLTYLADPKYVIQFDLLGFFFDFFVFFALRLSDAVKLYLKWIADRAVYV